MSKYPQTFIAGVEPGCKGNTITLETIEGIDFECHFEDGSVVIDRCKGLTPEEGLALFPAWALEAMCQNSSKTN